MEMERRKDENKQVTTDSFIPPLYHPSINPSIGPSPPPGALVEGAIIGRCVGGAGQGLHHHEHVVELRADALGIEGIGTAKVTEDDEANVVAKVPLLLELEGDDEGGGRGRKGAYMDGRSQRQGGRDRRSKQGMDRWMEGQGWLD